MQPEKFYYDNKIVRNFGEKVNRGVGDNWYDGWV